MESRMGMDNTIGQMEAFIKEILSMESAMDMGYGQTKAKAKSIPAATEWIKKKVLEFINGLESRHTKANSDRIFDKDLGDYIKSLQN